MFCKKCGSELSPSALFCKSCGEKVSVKQDVKGENTKKNKTLMIVLCVLLAVLLLVGAALAVWLLSGREDGEDSPNKPVVTVEPSVKPIPTALATRKNIEETVNAIIGSEKGHANIGVAVIDHKTGETYHSARADAAYPAWGFYLPIYLAYNDSPSAKDTRLLENVMSNDAATCNEAGNTIIQNMGGPSGITAFLRGEYGVTVTSYGRYFADVRATSDNYTSATEAVTFLEEISRRGGYDRLSYDITRFGIRAPQGATVYAQVGTENNQVRKNLNLFAVVEGEKSNYSVAILTQNGAGVTITEILEAIHTEMEG